MKNDFTISSSSICGDCAKSVGLCSWSSSLRPVDGWYAEEAPRRLCSGKLVTGYAVKCCPLFEKDERPAVCVSKNVRNTVWTPEDKLYVFANYGRLPTCEIAGVLGRTISAIHKMVSNERKKLNA